MAQQAANALPFPGHDVDVSGFVAQHGSDAPPTTLLKAPETKSYTDELLLEAAGLMLDGAPFVWVASGVLVPMGEVFVDERKAIVDDYRAVFAARVPGEQP